MDASRCSSCIGFGGSALAEAANLTLVSVLESIRMREVHSADAVGQAPRATALR